MFRQLAGQEQTYSSLDFPASYGTPLVVVSQAGRFSGNSLEDVVHERIHDRHCLARDSGVGMYLLQHFVDVDGEAFLPALLAFFLVAGTDGLLGLSGFFDSFS